MTAMPPLSAGRANIADVICIGAQRAMTSWLHRVLSAHPHLWAFPDFAPVTSTRKEAHFWDWNHHRGQEWYRVLMTPPDEPTGDATRLSMDFTPEYAFLSEAQIAECKALNPKARVIYILRDPLARAVSALRMQAMWQSDNAAPGDLEIDLDDRLFALMAPARLQEHADYAANHRRWARHYPDLLVLTHERLRADPLGGAARVLAHLGLSCEDMPQSAREALEARAAERIWQTPRYRFTPDALHFLHGAHWREREAAEAHFDLRFNEWREVFDQQGEEP